LTKLDYNVVFIIIFFNISFQDATITKSFFFCCWGNGFINIWAPFV